MKKSIFRFLVYLRGDDDALAAGVELRPPRSPEDLEHVQDPEVRHLAFLVVVDVRAWGSKRNIVDISPGFRGLSSGLSCCRRCPCLSNTIFSYVYQ